MRVWKIIAGERSKFWRQFVEEGVAAIKANEEGDLEGYPSQAEFREKIERFSSLSKKKSNEEYAEAWNFINCLSQGDLLLLYRRGYVSALGLVTGKYGYHDGRLWMGEKFFHRRHARWKMLDTSKQRLSPHLKNTLSKSKCTLEEIIEKEDILEVCHIAANELFCKDPNLLS